MSTESLSDALRSKDFMRRLQLFAGLTENDLEQLYEMSRTITLPEGDYLMHEGDLGDELYLIMAGELEVSKGAGVQEQVLAVRVPGEVVGEMAILEQAPRSASVRALRESRLLVINQAAFRTLLACSPNAAMTILQTFVGRLRNSESLLMQQQKLSALGTMAAGLAHELNNPATAIQRSTARLREALPDWEAAVAHLATLSLDEAQAQLLARLRERLAQQAPAPPLDPLSQSVAEEALQDWLEVYGVAAAWQSAPALLACGWTQEALEPLVQTFAPEQVPALLRWLAAGATVYGLLGEASTSAKAVSGLVKAVKNYTYLDEAPVQEVDIHESLESTLTILQHKMADNVTVVRDYAKDLPRPEAYGSELNQVWTNIIDNALEAMQGSGSLTLRTSLKGQYVVVELQDSGPGIPVELQPRLFEPFFTTKPVGAGTGLGLHIAYNIVVHRHHGQIRLVSQPGFACFQVTLPLRR